MLRIIPRRLLVEPRATVSGVSREGDETTATVRIDGLVCSACAAHVRGRLRRVPGVRAAGVDLDRGEAAVRYERDRVRPQALVAAVGGAVLLPGVRRLVARPARALATLRAARIAGRLAAAGAATQAQRARRSRFAHRVPVWPARFQ